MQIDITGQNIELTDSLRDYVHSKFDRIVRHFDHLIDVHVVLRVEKQDQLAEATIMTRGKQVFAEAGEADMYAAIDSMIDKLDRQLLKYKERMKNHHHEVPHKVMHLN